MRRSFRGSVRKVMSIILGTGKCMVGERIGKGTGGGSTEWWGR